MGCGSGGVDVGVTVLPRTRLSWLWCGWRRGPGRGGAGAPALRGFLWAAEPETESRAGGAGKSAVRARGRGASLTSGGRSRRHLVPGHFAAGRRPRAPGPAARTSLARSRLCTGPGSLPPTRPQLSRACWVGRPDSGRGSEFGNLLPGGRHRLCLGHPAGGEEGNDAASTRGLQGWGPRDVAGAMSPELETRIMAAGTQLLVVGALNAQLARWNLPVLALSRPRAHASPFPMAPVPVAQVTSPMRVRGCSNPKGLFLA